MQDAVWVPTCPHLASKNAPKSGLGGVLEASRTRLGGLLGRLGGILRPLGGFWRPLGRILVPLGPSGRPLGRVLGLQNPSVELDALLPGRGGGRAAATLGLSGRIRILFPSYILRKRRLGRK